MPGSVPGKRVTGAGAHTAGRHDAACRHVPEARAVCIKRARTDLRGGRGVIPVPTATTQDAEALLSIEERLTALKSVLPSYASVCGHAPRETKVAVIGYYGRLGRNIGPHRVVDESALAAEFDQATASFVVEANNYYRYCLIRHIAPHFERALHEMFATVASEPDTLEEEGAWISDPIVAAHHPWDTLGTD